MKITIPVEIAVKRFYRSYITIDQCLATDDRIKSIVKQEVVNHQDDFLDLDQELDIEGDDILGIDIDYDGAWPADEEDAE